MGDQAACGHYRPMTAGSFRAARNGNAGLAAAGSGGRRIAPRGIARPEPTPTALRAVL